MKTGEPINFFLKRHLGVWKTKDLICVGIPGSEQYLEVANQKELYSQFEMLTTQGVSQDELHLTELYGELLRRKMLDKGECSLTRTDLFFQHLGLGGFGSIATKRILILGAGAGGSTLAFLLAQIGFKEIAIVDADKVEYSDVSKSHAFRKCNVGQFKADALSETLTNEFDARCKPFVQKIDCYEDLDDIISMTRPDFIVKACDPNLSFRLMLNNACFSRKIPFIHMAYAYQSLTIGPLFVPDRTCCDNSMNNSLKRELGEGAGFEHHERLFDSYTTHPSISFMVNILSNIILKEIVFYLYGKLEYCRSIGKVVYYEPVSFKGIAVDLKCADTCPYACHK